jgi:hypothetical protein
MLCPANILGYLSAIRQSKTGRALEFVVACKGYEKMKEPPS